MANSFISDFQRFILDLLSPGVIGIYALIFLVVVITISSIIIWHWRKHAISHEQEKSVISLYVFPTLLLSVLCLISLLVIALN
jgi:uncharacterized membrane protein